MRDVAIVGVGMIKFGRYPEKTVPELAAQAALLALKDAGVEIKDVELVASGNLYQSNAMVGQRIMQIIGQTGVPVINVANACATGSTAFREAYMAVASGAYDMAMAVGSEQMGKMGLLGGGGTAATPPTAPRVSSVRDSCRLCSAWPASSTCASTAPRRSSSRRCRSRTTSTRWATRTAQYQTEVGLEEVLNARVVS